MLWLAGLHEQALPELLCETSYTEQRVQISRDVIKQSQADKSTWLQKVKLAEEWGNFGH